MEEDRRAEVHVSIQRGFTVPSVQKCNSCCSPPGRYHCPFCETDFFKPATLSRIRVHLDNHLKRAIYVGEHTIHRCGLACRQRPHYHCLYCTATVMRKRDFVHHLPLCCEAQKQRAQKRSQFHSDLTEKVRNEGLPALSPTDGVVSIYERNGDDDGEEVIVLQDSDNQNSAGEGSSESDHQTSTEKPQDCDEYYFMSLVKLFKRLSPQKKAEVRMKIERLLFEAEFD